MATKKKAAAKKPVAKKASKPAAKAASKPAARNGSTPKWVNQFVRYAEKNPAVALVGVIAVALGLMLIFG